jgi:hypothetical protein
MGVLPPGCRMSDGLVTDEIAGLHEMAASAIRMCPKALFSPMI